MPSARGAEGPPGRPERALAPVNSLSPRTERVAKGLREAYRAFIESVDDAWTDVWFQRDLIIPALQRVAEGRTKRLAITMPPQHGKLLADDTPIITTRGWITHGELKRDDCVFGIDGKPAQVLEVFKPDLCTWKLTFTNGEEIIAHGEHLWTVYDRSRAAWRTVDTETLAGTRVWSGERSRYQLPDFSALEFFVDEMLPMDPYTLGAWLGDGETHRARITLGSKKIAVMGRVAAIYGEPKVWDMPNQDGAHYFWGSALAASLSAAGVLHEKHIPEIYLRASLGDRRQLLAGLADTDGYIDPQGRIRYVTTSERLRDDVMELAHGLALRPGFLSVPPAVSSSGVVGRQTVFTIGFQSDGLLPTARLDSNPAIAKRRKIGIRSIERCAPKIGRCIKIDREDGLYLAGRSLVPTHNTRHSSELFGAWYLARNPRGHFMHLSYGQDLSRRSGREVRSIMQGVLYELLFPDSRIAPDVRAQDAFRTLAGGSYTARGFGGVIAGLPVDLMVIDDPIKKRDQATNPTFQKRFQTDYRSLVRTRLPKWGAVVLATTRWCVGDPFDRVIEEEGLASEGGLWESLKIPAEREDGSFLWEERFGKEHYELAKRDAVTWWSMYMQEPSGARVGLGWFRRPDVRLIDEEDVPKPGKFAAYLVVDPALGEKKSHDSTVILVLLAGEHDSVIWVDGVIDRFDPDDRAAAIKKLVRKWKPRKIVYEEYGLMIDTFVLGKQLKEAGIYTKVTPVGRRGPRHSMSKEDRIRGLIPDFKSGRIVMPRKMKRTLTNGEEFDLVAYALDEEIALYSGEETTAHDDFLDALARIHDPETDFKYIEPARESDANARSAESVGGWESQF